MAPIPSPPHHPKWSHIIDNCKIQAGDGLISVEGAMIHPLWPIAHTAYGNAFLETQDGERQRQHVPNQGVWQDTHLVMKSARVCRSAPVSFCAWKGHVDQGKATTAPLHPGCLTHVSCTSNAQSA